MMALASYNRLSTSLIKTMEITKKKVMHEIRKSWYKMEKLKPQCILEPYVWVTYKSLCDTSYDQRQFWLPMANYFKSCSGGLGFCCCCSVLFCFWERAFLVVVKDALYPRIVTSAYRVLTFTVSDGAISNFILNLIFVNEMHLCGKIQLPVTKSSYMLKM